MRDMVLGVHDDAIVYDVRLKGGREAVLVLPPGLTTAELQQLIAFLQTQVEAEGKDGRSSQAP